LNATLELTERDPIVVLAADEAFAMPLAVTVRSMLDNLASDRSLQIFILDGGISQTTKERLLRSWPKQQNYNIQWISINESVLEGLEVSEHISVAAYYRILMPRVLPVEIKRVIYLDSDLLVVRDLGELWDCEIGDHLCLAVQELFAPYLDASIVLPNFSRMRPYITKWPVVNYKALGFTPEMPYLNSGVLVIDLNAWRELDLTGQLLRCLHVNREYVKWWDQYALNVVLARRWGMLDPRWNQGAHIYRFPTWRFSHLTKETFRTLRNAPYIIHFNSPEKPWQADNRHPSRNEFFRYLDHTDWAGWRPADDKSWEGWWKFQKRQLRNTVEVFKHRVRARL
jgi:lipopolysaccharide biosynthesis glycosyltransferase